MGRTALFLCAVIARWIFRRAFFCWENARTIKNCGGCRERNGIAMRGQTIWQRGLTALFAAVFMAALLVGCGQDAKQAAGSYT